MNEIKEIILEAWALSPKETIKTIVGLLGIVAGIALFSVWFWRIILGVL